MSKTGYLFAFGAIFLWSWNVIISRYLAPYIPPFQISFFRWLIASIALLPFFAVKVWKARRAFVSNWWVFLILSFGLAFMNNFIYQAGHSTSAVDMSLLATMGPIFLVIFSWLFFKKSISKRQVLGFFVSFLGVMIVISNGTLSTFTEFQFAKGNLWMVVFALSFGMYGALEIKRSHAIEQFTYLAATVFLGTLMLVPFFWGTLEAHPLSNIKLVQWGMIIYLGICNSIFAYLAWNIALAKLGSLRCGLIYYSLPIFSSIWAYYVLHESIGYAEFVGALFVFAGIFIGSVKRKSNSSKMLDAAS